MRLIFKGSLDSRAELSIPLDEMPTAYGLASAVRARFSALHVVIKGPRSNARGH